MDTCPKRKKIYCSPACGGGCTHAKYMEACRESRKPAQQLGVGWTAEVHENLGGHGKTPKEAIKRVISTAKSDLKTIGATLNMKY